MSENFGITKSFRGLTTSGKSCVRHRIIGKVIGIAESKFSLVQMLDNKDVLVLATLSCCVAGQLLQVGQLLLTHRQERLLNCQVFCVLIQI